MKCVSTEGDSIRGTWVIQKMAHIILGKRKQYLVYINKTASILETIKTKNEYSDQQLRNRVYRKCSVGLFGWLILVLFPFTFHMFLNFQFAHVLFIVEEESIKDYIRLNPPIVNFVLLLSVTMPWEWWCSVLTQQAEQSTRKHWHQEVYMRNKGIQNPGNIPIIIMITRK